MSDEKEIKEEVVPEVENEESTQEEKTQANSLEEKILLLESENKELTDKYFRILAEMQNLIKRQTKEKDDFVKYANEEIITEFLSVYDHLNLAINFLPEAEKASNWVKGVEYTIKQFKDLLNVNGVQEIKTVGEKFDPNTMEALEGKGEKVVKEISAGYRLNEKVIRAARVALE